MTIGTVLLVMLSSQTSVTRPRDRRVRAATWCIPRSGDAVGYLMWVEIGRSTYPEIARAWMYDDDLRERCQAV